MLNLSAGGGPTSGLQHYYQQQAALPVATAALNSVGGGVGGQCSQAQQQMALAALQQAAVAGASASASASATGASPQTQLLSMQLLQPSAAALFSPASLQGLQGLQNAQCLQGYQMLPTSAQLGAAAQNQQQQQQQQFLAQLSLMQQLVYPSGLPQLQLSLPYPFHLPHLSQSTAALPFVAGPAFVPDLSPPSAAPHVLKVLVASVPFHSRFRLCSRAFQCQSSRTRTETHFQSALVALYVFTNDNAFWSRAFTIRSVLCAHLTRMHLCAAAHWLE